MLDKEPLRGNPNWPAQSGAGEDQLHFLESVSFCISLAKLPELLNESHRFVVEAIGPVRLKNK